MTGRVHSFQSLGTVDGPGIRYVVFMQGCNLRCSCCHNPDTWDMNGGTEYTAEEILSKVLRFREYFGEKGGITISGGEPLLQADYIKEVCKRIPEGWQKRIETSLNVSWDKIKLLIPYINQWIIDIKDSHQDIYKDYTGVDGLLVYENVQRLSGKVGKDKLLIRIPEIPEYNTEECVITSMEIYSEYGMLDVFKYRKMNR